MWYYTSSRPLANTLWFMRLLSDQEPCLLFFVTCFLFQWVKCHKCTVDPGDKWLVNQIFCRYPHKDRVMLLLSTEKGSIKGFCSLKSPLYKDMLLNSVVQIQIYSGHIPTQFRPPQFTQLHVSTVAIGGWLKSEHWTNPPGVPQKCLIPLLQCPRGWDYQRHCQRCWR